jgi:hypothetical protein
LCAQKGLTLPSVQVDLDAVDKAFAPHVPVVDVSKPAGNGELNIQERQSGQVPNAHHLLAWHTSGMLRARLQLLQALLHAAGTDTAAK